jgi:hypothetical protein
MNGIGAGIAIAVLGLSIAAHGQEGSDRPAKPAEQYKALLREYQRASSGGVLSDQERMKFVGRTYKLRNNLALQFVTLAEKFPQDPIALDALLQAVWQVNGTPWPVGLVGQDGARAKAFALLLRDHISSDKLGPTCERISFGFCQEYETFLRAVLEKNPHQDVRAQGCLALAQLLSNRQQRVDLVSEQPELAQEFADLFGKEYLQELQRQDPAKITREAESLLEQAKRQYADVKLPEGGTVGEKTAAALFALRHLTIGKGAPDIEGEDQDGTKFKLSDYRGKVVLLDFWSEY